jgi:16S rRNA (guanine527-N7)-methyltransferase
VVLLETTGKKARFLERCVAELPLPRATVLNGRAEHAGQDPEHRQRYDAAMCRAVGPMRELLEYTLPLVRVGGVVLAMKGAKVEAELDASGDALTTLGAGQVQLLDAWPPPMARDGVTVLVHKEHPTPRAYPRAAGTPRRLSL